MISSRHLLPDIGVESSVHWAFIRSRRKLIQEGEQNSAYFLEREQAKNNQIKKNLWLMAILLMIQEILQSSVPNFTAIYILQNYPQNI